MAAINFPTATSNGQTFEADTGVIYTYVGSPPNGFWSATFATTGLTTLDNRYIAKNDGNSIQTMQTQGLKFNNGSADTILLDGVNGKVGIGVTPQRDLHIHNASSTTNTYLQLTSATTGTGSTDGFQLLAYGSGSSTNAAIIQRENAALEIWTNNTEQMRIDSSGNVGIGSTNPTGDGWSAANDLVINSTGNSGMTIKSGASSFGQLVFNDAAGGLRGFVAYGHSDDYLGFGTSGAERMRIDISGNVYIGGTTAATADIALNANGSATFRGNLVNGTATSYIGTYANTNNGAVLYGVLSNAEKWRIAGDGAASFANVTADYYFAVRDTTNEDYLSLQTGNNNGVKVLHKGTGIFIGSNLTNVNASVPTGTQTKLLTDGSATFASAVTANNVITRLYSASQYLYLGSANDVLFYRHDGTSSGQQQVKIARTGNASFAGTVSAQGSVLTSDARFKTNIEPAGSQLSDVVQLGNLLKNWNWKEDAPVADKDIRFLGLVAQDVATVCPGIVKTIDRTKQGAELTPEKVVPAVYEEQVIPAVYKEQIIPAEYKTILVPAEVDDEGNKISPPKTEKVLVTPEQTEQVLVTPEQTKQVLVKEEEVIPATYEELDDSYKGIKNDVLVMKLLGAVAELSAKVAALEAA